ncbi:MAG: DUF402 domain-containing protein [Sulfolobales archaeon]|nr:DUF402 domain-containing protein [Sulfolobales archaeon]MDW8083251.1 DUF402 domain-containing protein [Sulfolobales archaeon]
MNIKVRVRGIYSTAISKILHDRGFELVDVSDIVTARLGIPENRGLPADVTVKTDNDDASKILVIGHADHSETVTYTLLESVPAVISYIPVVGLYATMVVSVRGLRDGRCFVETPYGLAELIEYRDCREGMLIPASVLKVPIHPGDQAILVPGVRVVGDFAVVWKGSRVLFSPHLKNKNRISELLSISSRYVRKGIGIKWRSNADEANLEAVAAELQKLVNQLDSIEGKVGSLKEVSTITKGEKIVAIYLTYDAKIYLDSVRRTVTPTADYHHMIKTSKGLYRDMAEILDEISAYVDREVLRKTIRRYIARTTKEIGELVINHKKLDGRNIRLGTANIAEFYYDSEFKLILERRVKNSGMYDGIRVKKEVGDIIKTVVFEGASYIVHNYFSSSGEFKGVYVNINTKPEIVVPNAVEYVDLAIDIARARSQPCELLDQEELRSYMMSRSIALSQETYEYIIKGIDTVLNEFCL